MATSLDGLETLLGPSFEQRNPGVALARTQEKLKSQIKRNLELAANDPHHFGTGATQSDLSDVSSDLEANPYSDANLAKSSQFQQGLDQQFDPRVQQLQAKDLANKLAIAKAPAEAQGAGALAVEQEKNKGAMQQLEAGQAEKDKLYQAIGLTGPGGRPAASGAPGTFKPTINAQGGVSFTQNQIPALVQRARDQLSASRDQTIKSLQDAEKMYPGINDAADQADQGGEAPGWLSTITGIGAQKYGSAMDLAKAANDRLKYSVGVPTPFANLAQSSSFANIEQMAGQLPGVRGLATITPLFKEHQSRWGKETPLATVQRLRHMARIMDDTISGIETGGVGQEPAQ